MIFFEHLFIVIARFFLKIWSKYKNWWVNVRYGITVLFIMNLGTLQALTDSKLTALAFMSAVIITYLIITFLKPNMNDKDFVKNYKTQRVWKKISITYIFGSISLFVFAFLIFVVKI